MRRGKILTTIIAVMIAVALLLTGCSGSQNDTQSGAADNSAEVVMTVNGQEITVDELGFYIANAAAMKGLANGEAVDWTQKDENGKSIAEAIKEQAINDIIGHIIISKLGEENGVGLTDEEKAQVDSMIGQVRTNQGEEYLQLALESSGVGSEDGFKSAYNLMMSYSKASQDMADNQVKYINPEDVEKLAAYKSDEMASVQHILILNDSEKHEDPKAAIDEVLRRAKSGEDFNALMTEFNEDPGQGPGGYTFGRGEMVAEFENASFALDYNEISDVVESSYGYHIIKRLVGGAELQAYLMESVVVEKNEDVLNNVSAENVVERVNSAVGKLNTIIGGEN